MKLNRWQKAKQHRDGSAGQIIQRSNFGIWASKVWRNARKFFKNPASINGTFIHRTRNWRKRK